MFAVEDPLDSADFDPVSFINQRFPTEASLDGLDTFVAAVNSQIATLDEEISKSIQTQSVSGKQATQDITEAQIAIQELFDKIAEIKSQASESEKMVSEICADIKRLDCAKTHLQSTITSMKRLQMLMTAVEQLEILVDDLQYREIANLLDAAKQLLAYFDKYLVIPFIAELNDREISGLVDTIANAESAVTELPGNMKSFSDACLVVDSLGLSARKEFIDEFIDLQLIPYDHLFGEGSPHHGIEHTDRRWAWIKRLLKSLDAKFGSIFPGYWNILYRLVAEFFNRTKEHMLLVLTAFSQLNDQTEGVHAILSALQSTKLFEQEMVEKYANTIVGNTPAGDSSPSGTAITAVKKLSNKNSVAPLPVENNCRSDIVIDVNMLIGSVSGEFDVFLGPYVLLERQNLENMLQQLFREEGINKEGESSGAVLGSAMNMFSFIKGSIKRCIALSNGQTFLSLCKEFRSCMQQYAESLRSRCPMPVVVNGVSVYRFQAVSSAPGTTGATSAAGGHGETISMLCYLVNTGEYCSDVIGQLEGLIKSKMQDDLVDRVDLNPEVELFIDLVAHILKVLVSGTMDRIDGSFREMMAFSWGTMAQVGEESAFLRPILSTLQEIIPILHETLDNTYFRNCCTKIATEISQRFLDCIVRQKLLSEMGNQQLLLDTHYVKTLLHTLPNLGLDASCHTPPPGMYVKMVNSRIAHIETVLKLAATPEDMLSERFNVMWPSGTGADLQMIMTLKGMKRAEQQVVLEALQALTGGNPNTSADTSAGAGDANATSSSITSSLSAASSTSASIVTSSMRFLTQDMGISSSARSAVGNLKWSSSTGESR